MIIIDSVDRKEFQISDKRKAVSAGISVEITGGITPSEALYQLMFATEEIASMFPEIHSKSCDETDCPPRRIAAIVHRAMQELNEEVRTFHAMEAINDNEDAESTKHNKQSK